MAYQNSYKDMKCVITFGKESKQRWLGFQQKRAELAVRQLQGMNADELKQLRSLLSDSLDTNKAESCEIAA